MEITKSFSSQLFKDFSFLFSSNILKKFLGFIRELILAFLFGSSLVYASYLVLKTLTDFFSQFTFGNALQANIVPRFSKLYKENTLLNLNNIDKFSKKIIVYIFLISFLFQCLLILLLIKKFYLVLFISSFFLSVILSANFYNSLFLSIIQARGDFKKFSFSTSLNILVATLFLYPLSLMLNIIGITISRLLGVLSLSYFYIKPIVLPNSGLEVNLSSKDFNFSVIFLANSSLFTLLLARLIIGFDGSNQIAFFNYSFILLNIILTSVIFNINIIFLRKISINKSLVPLLYSTLITLIISCILYFIVSTYSFEIVNFIFKRGAFNNEDAISTALFLRLLTPAYIVLMFSTLFFQPFFSLGINKIYKISNRFTLFLFLVLISIISYIFLKNIELVEGSFLFINLMSKFLLLISLVSLIYYIRHENK